MASKDYPIPDALALLNNNFKASTTARSGVAGNLQWPEGGNYDYIQIDIVDFVKVLNSLSILLIILFQA